MKPVPTLDPERLVPPPAELRPALAEAMRRVKILRHLLRLSESINKSTGNHGTKPEAANASR
jgi:hypothetical protein